MDAALQALHPFLGAAVTNPTLPSTDPSDVGRSKMYTQIVDELSIGPGPHKVAIKFTHKQSGR